MFQRARGELPVFKSGGLWLGAHIARREWRLLTLVGLGVLLVSLLLAAIPVLLDSLAELGLAQRVRLERVDLLDIQVLATDRPSSRADHARADAVVAGALAQHLGPLQRDRVQYGKSATFFLKRDPQEQISPSTLRATLFFMERFEEHVRLPAGRLPQPGAVGEEVEVALGSGPARAMGLQVGDRVFLVPFASEPANWLPVRITGLVEPRDADEEYWLGNLLHFEAQTDPTNEVSTIPLYVREESFLDVMGARYPTVLSDYWWNVYIHPGLIKAKDRERLERGLVTLRADINKGVPRSTTFTRLDDLLREHRQRVALARVPLLLLVSFLVLTTAYYAALLGSLLVQRLSPDIALWKSRGARGRSVLATFLGLGLAQAAIGMALGPPLALGLVALAGSLGVLRPVTAGASLPVRWLPSSYGLAALGSGLTLAAFLVPALLATRQTLVEARERESRPPRQPAFLRYFLDLPVLAATGLLTWQAATKGSVFGRPLQGEGVSLDPVFLLLPTLLLLSVLLLIARLFPSVGGLLSLIGGRLGAAAPTAAWRHLARNPIPYVSLAALFVLVAVLVSFGATMSHSLARSYQERVHYEVGADARVEQLADRSASDEEALRGLAQLSDVSRATLVYRGRARLGTAGGGEDFTILGLDPPAFSQVAWFRADFGAATMDALLSPLKARPSSALTALPRDATALGVWVYAERELPESRVQVRLLAAPREATELTLGPLAQRGWQFLRVELPTAASGGAPYRVASIFLTQRRGGLGTPSGSLSFDDLTAFSPGEPQGRVLDGFEEAEGWEALPHRGFAQDRLETSADQVRGGLRSLRLSWTSGLSEEPRGLLARQVATPLPGVANVRLVGLTGQPPGQRLWATVEGVPVPLAVQATARFFPTIAADREPFLVVSREALLTYLEGLPGARPPRANEAWLALRPRAEPDRLLGDIKERFPTIGRGDIVLRPQLLAEVRGDPLGSAGWVALLALAVGVAVVLGLLGFVVAAAAASQRARVEFAVLRTFGLSQAQLLTILASEYLFSVGVGLLGGGALGYGLGRFVLSLLDVTERGVPVLPPIAVEVGWGTVVPLLLGLLLALTAATMVLGAALGRESVAARLRLSQ